MWTQLFQLMPGIHLLDLLIYIYFQIFTKGLVQYILLLSEIQEFHKNLLIRGSKNFWNLKEKKSGIFKSHFELIWVQHSKLSPWKSTATAKYFFIFLVVDWIARIKEGGAS